LIVSVGSAVSDKTQICGQGSLEKLAKDIGSDIFLADAYSLGSPVCSGFFEKNSFGIGISMGWQRLIPETVLNRFSHGIFGLHGSCGYLPFGQGRSTLNRSLLKGDRRFVMNLFKLDKNADSPNIYSNEMFEITPFDDIRTLQYKNILSGKRQVKRLLEDYENGKALEIKTQSKDFQSFYEKRTPDDGKLDFKARTDEIYNLIRAVTKPFPGAFAFANGQKITIWKAIPFDMIFDFSDFSCGEVIDVFDGKPLIRTLDGSLLITGYESGEMLKKGDILE